MTSRWLDGLNPEQAAVVGHTHGPICVLAGAGSGKTKALVARIGRLIDDGAGPRRILAVTFSKKAADEMNERIIKQRIRGARVGTWHSLCWQILRDDETIYASWQIDQRDRHKAILKEAMGYKHVDWKEGDLGEVRRFIAWCKANLWGPKSENAQEEAAKRFGSSARRAVDVYKVSEMLVADAGLLTFDDMLMRVWEHLLFEKNRARWAASWDHLLQDEGQDANRAQVVIAEMLARDHRNYMIVGDMAQSIYGFRGSSPDYLRDFADEWQAPVVCMNRNYRSGSAIVGVANDSIRRATVRLPSDLHPERTIAGDVRIVGATDLDDEAQELAAHVEAHAAEAEAKLADFCVLFRTNAQSRAIEEALLGRKIPYVVIGGCIFYERKEVRDLLAYLRLAAERDPDGDAVRRCINAPFRYLGPKFVDRMLELARGRKASWATVVRYAASHAGIQRRQQESAEEWCDIIEAAQTAIAREERPAAVLSEIVRKTRYVEWLERDQGEESIEDSHAANVRELVRVAERFKSVGELLDFIDKNIAAAQRQRRGQDGGDQLLLMSVHRAKGLEWPRVWVVGCNDGILPHAKGDPEEERRIFYVAVTRAKDELTLSYVGKLASRRGVLDVEPSRFLRDAHLIDEPGADAAE
jgi:DNA helicase II / ATP-dependent DNA helicase PcrA